MCFVRTITPKSKNFFCNVKLLQGDEGTGGLTELQRTDWTQVKLMMSEQTITVQKQKKMQNKYLPR